MKNITILGCTGSIGVSTLDVVAQHLDKYKIFALSAWKNIELLLKQVKQFKPKYVVVCDENNAKILQQNIQDIKLTTQVLYGQKELCNIASSSEVDIVMSAIVGTAGLKPTFEAAINGKTILLANKEALVAAGNILTQAISQYNAKILPVDSEHNAIYQCYNDSGKNVKSIILTASGGPFLHTDIKEFEHITPDMACKHPKWSMGRKISVDSATMMNKGLEVIEAYWLFPNTQNNISIAVHPQSIVHSLVEYIDGSIIAQMSNPDMRIPIAYGLAYPNRITCNTKSLDITTLTELNFYPPDLQKFPCIKLAYEALASKQCITLNASNEIAVEAFLNNKIGFKSIYKCINDTMMHFSYSQPENIEEVIDIDIEARNITKQILSKYNI